LTREHTSNRKRHPGTNAETVLERHTAENMTDTVPESTRQTLDRLYENPEHRLTSLFELAPDDEQVDGQLTMFKALANQHRIRILEALRDGELCACELQVVLDAPQSTVASHLRELKDAGLVNTRRQGKWTYYRIGDTAVLQLLDIANALTEEGG
jgi:ArsR family transcriptional regulator